MRYFIIEEDKKIKNLPHIKNWMKKIDARKLQWGSYHELPEITTLYVEQDDFLVWADLLSSPFFLFNKKLYDIVKYYEPNMGYRQIMLIDYNQENVCQYYLPHLKIIDCLTQETVFNRDHGIIERAVIDSAKIGDKTMFQLDKVNNRYVVVRLDLLESILRRGAIVTFTEIEVK